MQKAPPASENWPAAHKTHETAPLQDHEPSAARATVTVVPTEPAWHVYVKIDVLAGAVAGLGASAAFAKLGSGGRASASTAAAVNVTL